MSESGQEKTEEATPRRRTDARKKGTVAKSQDLTNALVVLALVLVFPMAISNLGSGFMQSISRGLRDIPQDLSPSTLGRYLSTILQPSLMGISAIILTAMIVGVASNFAQVGFVMSTEALQPSFGKLNPANGLKRLFSFSATFDGMKATVKAMVFMGLAWSAISGSWPQLVGLTAVTPTAAMGLVGGIMKSIALKVGIAWLVLASIDYFYQRKQINKQLKMTKEDVKREMKEAETSPELRMAMMRRRRQLSKSRVADAVKKANVIITNPTHYAIAIQYEAGKQHAPIVVAKGQDFLAAKIRELAKEHRIPIVPNPPLARALYKKCEIGDYVPRELFQAVAEVLAHVYRTIKKVRSR